MAEKKRVWRRLLFALVPLAALLVAATLILSQLEKRKVIVTERPDDSVLYAPAYPLEKIRNDRGEEMYRLSGYNMLTATIPVRKGPRTCRVVVAGESFILGLPYFNPTGNSLGCGDIPQWVQAELELRYPTWRFEVINAGAGGRTSHGVGEIVEALLEAQPDVVVVATGNNEGVVPVTAFNEIVHRWVVYRLLKKNLLPEPELNNRPYLSVQDSNGDNMRSGFERNIRSMAQAVKAKGVPLVLCTMPINLRFEDPTLVKPDDFIRQGRELYAQGRYQEAIEALSRSAQQGEAAKIIGDCLLAQGKYGHAKTMYKIAVQLNPLNRTRPSLNETVRRICREENLPLVDLEQLVEDQSPHGIPEINLFCDYCHMTWRGYAMVAHEMVQVMISRGLIGAGRDTARFRPTIEQMIAFKHWERLLSPSLKYQGCLTPPGVNRMLPTGY